MHHFTKNRPYFNLFDSYIYSFFASSFAILIKSGGNKITMLGNAKQNSCQKCLGR